MWLVGRNATAKWISTDDEISQCVSLSLQLCIMDEDSKLKIVAVMAEGLASKIDRFEWPVPLDTLPSDGYFLRIACLRAPPIDEPLYSYSSRFTVRAQ